MRNSEGFRWSRPYPEKRADTYHVIVVGDSLTYGEGLAEEWKFTNLLEQWLSTSFKIEFLNLPHNGYQSEDVLEVIRKHLTT